MTTLLEHAKARSADVRTRIREAIRTIESEIEEHGVYPLNGGRLTQAEVCRRAAISKVTLQGPVHKRTTKRDLDIWLAGIRERIRLGYRAVRKRVTERADSLQSDLNQIKNNYHLAELEMISMRTKIADLESRERDAIREQKRLADEVRRLNELLSGANVVDFPKKPN